MDNISAGCSPTTFLTMTGTAVSEHTHHTPHTATTAACATLWPMDASITTHTMTHPTSIVTPHPALSISSTNITYATIPQTAATLAPATSTTLHRKHTQKVKPHPRPSTTINPTIQRLSSSRFPLQNLPYITTVTLIL